MNQAQYEAEREALTKQCHTLIGALACRSNCLKLLTLAKNHLELLSQYKANRRRSL